MKEFYLRKHGNYEDGFLTPIEKLGFDIKRVYIVQDSLGIRGNHAHRECDQVFVCLKGRVDIVTEDKDGRVESYCLYEGTGVKIPRMVWHSINYYNRITMLMGIASMEYSEEDYIRDYTKWKEM